jgi:hypothetical protein
MILANESLEYGEQIFRRLQEHCKRVLFIDSSVDINNTR